MGGFDPVVSVFSFEGRQILLGYAPLTCFGPGPGCTNLWQGAQYKG